MTRSTILCLLLILHLVSFSPSSSSGGERGDVFGRAEAFLRDGLYLEAIGDYQDTADRAENDEIRAGALFKIGDIYSYFLDDYDTSVKYYYLVKTKHRNSSFAANAWFNSGMIFYEKGRYRDALSQFQTYLKKYPEGARRETAEYMIAACRRETPAVGEKGKRSLHETAGGRKIRVLISSSAGESRVETSSPAEVNNLAGGTILKRTEGGVWVFGRAGNGLTIDGHTVAAKGLAVRPSADGMLKVNGKRYRGEIRILGNRKEGMEIINIVDLEAYLYGVVPKEMSPRWPLEALKAQAVAARTFALYQIGKSGERAYDVSATTMSQVYGGFDAETASAVRAVDETKGRVLYHAGKPILAYFHSNSGGATEDAKNVWTTDIPYLKGVRDEYSAGAPGNRWTVSLARGDLAKALAGGGVPADEIRDLVPVDVSPSGRVVKLKVVHDRGETVLRANDFRLRVNPHLLKSTFFELAQEGNGFRFDGKGFGHGVGLSQWGAYEMARRGFSCQDILKHYYQKAEVRYQEQFR